jgi:hypothetical protein
VSQVAWVSVTVINSSSLSRVHVATDHIARGHDRPRRAARFEGGKAPSKEKHDPPAGRVVSTVTRDLPLVAAFRRTVGSSGKFPAPASVLVSPLHVHLRERFAGAFRRDGDR